VTTISIAISTYAERIANIKLFESHPHINYVVVHQQPQGVPVESMSYLKNRNDVLYIPTNTKGLSISRYIAIKNSTGDYIMIMDDDVDFFLDSIEKLITCMDEDDVDISTYYHKYTNGKTTKNKDHSFYHNRLNIANPSSIDICLKRESIIASGVLFDEDFGLGTNYPSGEEMIFLSDCIKSGLKLKRYPIEVCIHPPVTSGSDFYSTKEKILAKKAMFKRVYGQLGGLMFILFILKKYPAAYKAGYGLFFLKQSFFK
jgi:glycosyltransferase involved in cell wall biosynthesis